jgi:prepilin-type N-terminal cleavage/methylation domain-containing protein
MIRRLTVRNKVRSLASCERGFTLIELLIVIIIIGIMLGAVTIMTYASMRNTDVKAAAEMLKQDLRKTYAMAAAGDKPACEEDLRYRYKIVFNGNTDSPANCYVIWKGTPAGGTYGWTEMTPRGSEANKRSGNYIYPSSSGSTKIDYGDYKTIYFASAGSITVANTTGDTSPGSDMTVNVTDAGGHGVMPIHISGYGSISD